VIYVPRFARSIGAQWFSSFIRWEPPPAESQNGLITGYKLRWRKKGDESEVVTTDGSRRLFAITGLKNGKEYQVSSQIQSCQIFLDTIYQNGGKYTKFKINYQLAVKYTKWP
jgi:hypothetical protein